MIRQSFSHPPFAFFSSYRPSKLNNYAKRAAACRLPKSIQWFCQSQKSMRRHIRRSLVKRQTKRARCVTPCKRKHVRWAMEKRQETWSWRVDRHMRCSIRRKLGGRQRARARDVFIPGWARIHWKLESWYPRRSRNACGPARKTRLRWHVAQ